MSVESREKAVLITGGAGFIGSHVVRRFVNKYPEHAKNLLICKIINSKQHVTFLKNNKDI